MTVEKSVESMHVFVRLTIIAAILRRAPTANGISSSSSQQWCPQDWGAKMCNCEVEKESQFPVIICQGFRGEDVLPEAFSIFLDSSASFKSLLIGDAVEVSTLPATIFKGVSFDEVTLFNTTISHIDNGTFAELKDTLSIVLKRNNFHTFNFSSLQYALSIRYFELSDDHLTTIPSNAFGPSEFLKFLNFSGNSIEFIGEHAFSRLTSLQRIVLSSNRLSTLGPFTFDLKTENPLLSLDLSNNTISKIDINSISDLRCLWLDLSYNNLTSLNESVFKTYISGQKRNLFTINFKGNPFVCGSDKIDWTKSLPSKTLTKLKNIECTPAGQPHNDTRKVVITNEASHNNYAQYFFVIVLSFFVSVI